MKISYHKTKKFNIFLSIRIIFRIFLNEWVSNLNDILDSFSKKNK